MIISSRYSEDDDAPVIGNGSIILQINVNQLELITALVCSVRLGGNSVYSTAAFELINIIENDFGSDFLDDSNANVDLNATIEDDTGVVLNTKTGQYDLTLEV